MRQSPRPMVYIAAPLFSQAEREFNLRLRESLRDYVDVYLPQEDGGLFVEMVDSGLSVDDAACKVFVGDVRAIEACHYLLLVMDGRSIDEGAAFELGFAAAKQKVCVGLQTDMRRLLPIGNNPMISGALMTIFNDVGALSNWFKEQVDHYDTEGTAEHNLRRLL
jgi:nucleoside 2-deoxyribosyltransferase